MLSRLRHVTALMLLLLTQVFCQAAWAQGATVKKVTSAQNPTEQKTILVLGDSLSAAYNIPQEKGWVSLLEQRLNEKGYDHKVVNASVSGETSGGALTRLPALLKSAKPDIAVVELGGNDGLRGYPVDTLRNNLSTIIKTLCEQEVKVILAGMQLPPNYGRRYTEAFEAIYSELSEQHEITLIPFFLENVGGQTDLIQSDGIHPRVEAQPQLLNNVWPFLVELLPDRS